MSSKLNLKLFCSLLISMCLIGQVQAAEGDANKKYEDAEVTIRVIPRGKENISAFHQGRGFPKFALDEIAKVCYVTVLMRNHSEKVHWLELDNWRFSSEDKNFKRLDRSYWKKHWNELNLALSYQSTFGWYLLPEQRDLHHDEPVGGSVTLVDTRKPFSMELRFRVGEDKSEGEKVVRFDNLKCEAS